MALYERLLGYEEPKLHVHGFMSIMNEYEKGKVTRQQVIDGFGLSASEGTELDTLFAKFIPIPVSIAMGAFVTLTNIGVTYDNTNASKGLGFVRLECAGITGAEFVVRVNKIGSGTQSWQLWDDTNGAEIGVINDAGATGDKELSITITPGSPLTAGMRTLRVRAKSTTAADDPLYYGASLRIRRVGTQDSEVLHQILILGEDRTPPYDSVSAVKTRLGIA